MLHKQFWYWSSLKDLDHYNNLLRYIQFKETLPPSLSFGGGVSLGFSYHPSAGERSLDSSLVTAVANFCSVGKWFQALCGAVCILTLVAYAKLMVCIRNLPLLVVWIFMFRDGYKLGGVRWEQATLKTTQEVPASKVTWRTSPFSDHR
ncbi:hypothetical protein Bca4012_064536 [Brassica carinata]